MRSSEEIYAAICEAVTAVTGAAREKLSLSTKLVSDLNMESIDMLDMLFEIEKKLDVSVNLAAIAERQPADKPRQTQFDLAIGELAKHIEEAVKL